MTRPTRDSAFGFLTGSLAGGRFARASFWSLASELTSRGLPMLAMLIVARILDPGEFGQFGLIRDTVGLLVTVGGLGLGITANKYVAATKATEPHKAGQLIGTTYLLAIATGSAVALGLYLMSGPIAVTLLDSPALKADLKIASLIVLLSAFNGAQRGVLQGFEAFHLIAAGGAISGSFAVIAFSLGSIVWGSTGAVVGLLGQMALSVIVFEILILRESKRLCTPRDYRKSMEHLPVILNFSIPVVLAGLVVAPFKWYPQTILVRDVGFTEVGMFQAAFLLATVVVTLSSTVHAPLISMWEAKVSQAEQRHLSYLGLYGSWYSFLLLAMPLLFLPELSSFFLGPNYDTPAFKQLTVLFLCYTGMLLYYQGIVRVFIRQNRMWFSLLTNLVEGLSLLGAFLFFRDHGVFGLIYAYLVSYMCRITFSLPYIVSAKLIELRMLFDLRFLLSVVTFTIAVIYNLTT